MSESPPPFPLFGETMSLLAALVWGFTVCAYRKYAAGIPAISLALYKNAVALALLLLTVLALRSEAPDGTAWALLGLSGILGLAVSDVAFYASLARVGPQLSSAVQCLIPPFTAVLGFAALAEALRPGQIAGMALTTLAVLAVVLLDRRAVRPGRSRDAWGPGLAFAIVAAVTSSFALVLVRDALPRSDVFAGTAVRFAPAVAALLLVQPLAGRWQRRAREAAEAGAAPETPRAWTPGRCVALAVIAFFGTYLGVILLSAGMKYAAAGVVAALSSTYPVWVIPVSAVLLDEPCPPALVSSTVLAVAGVSLLFAG
jgi:drug/metabolite transporter (DMT)-like permease